MFSIGLGRMGAVGGGLGDVSAAIRALFANSEAGLWYEPGLNDTLFQDSAGTTPVTAVGQPVGRMLDKSGRGNHASQATAAARPVLSARVNLATSTETVTAGLPWNCSNYLLDNNVVAPPMGYAGSTRITATAVPSAQGHVLGAAPAAGTAIFVRCVLKAGTKTDASLLLRNVSTGAPLRGGGLDMSTGVITGAGYSVENLGDGWHRVTVTASSGFVMGDTLEMYYGTTGAVSPGLFWYATGMDYQVGLLSRYQRVNTATDYDTAGFPYYEAFDGIDDGVSTATFAAGTLTSNMDCFIAMKRNSGDMVVTVSGVTDGTYFFAYMNAAATPNVGATNPSAGSSTYFVDGVQLAGATAVTPQTLDAAVGVAKWVVLEVRNVDLSAWTKLGLSIYSGLPLNGQIGGIVLCPAQSDAKRTQIRQYLAAKVGVTL